MYIVWLNIPKEKLKDIVEKFEGNIAMIEAPPYSLAKYRVKLRFYDSLKDVIELLQKHDLLSYLEHIYTY